MMSNNMTRLEIIQTKLPQFYKKYVEDDSVIYAFIKSLSSVDEHQVNISDRLNAMIGIDTCYDEDLEFRWGSFLGLKKTDDETYYEYRSKLKIIITRLIGGTRDAIKYGLASFMNINNDLDAMNRHIRVYDAWDNMSVTDFSAVSSLPIYQASSLLNSNNANSTLNSSFTTNNIIDYSIMFANFLCFVDITDEDIKWIDTAKAYAIVDSIKASGTKAYIIFLLATLLDQAKLGIDELVTSDIDINDGTESTIFSSDTQYIQYGSILNNVLYTLNNGFKLNTLQDNGVIFNSEKLLDIIRPITENDLQGIFANDTTNLLNSTQEDGIINMFMLNAYGSYDIITTQV